MSDVKEEKSPTTSVKLFVGDLSVRFTREMLFDLFKVYGKVTEVNINRGAQDDKLCTGFGFVSFSSKEMASLAKQSLNATLHYGRKLRIGWAGRDEELLERPSTVVELFFSFKSSKMKHFLYEQTVRELVAEYTDCEVIDVAMKSYIINTHIPSVFGAGFVHFPVTRQGVAAAKLISNVLKRVTIQDIHYDCKLAHSLQSLLEGIPELREEASNSKDISTLEKGDNSEQVGNSISESTTTADSIVTSSETISMGGILETEKHEKTESAAFNGIGWTSDSMIQLQNKSFSYATFREMMHLIPAQSSSTTRNVDRLLSSPSNKSQGGDQLRELVSVPALQNLSLQHPPKQNNTAVRVEQYPSNSIACASPHMTMSVGQYSSFNSPSSPSVAFGLQRPLSEQLFQQQLPLHTQVPQQHLQSQMMHQHALMHHQHQHHQQSHISQQLRGGGGGELTLSTGYYGLPAHMLHHQQQRYIGQSQQRAEYLRDLHSQPLQQLQSCYSPPYGHINPVAINSSGYPYHQGYTPGQELFYLAGGGANAPYNTTTLLPPQPPSPQQLQQQMSQAAWGGNTMDNTQMMPTYVGDVAAHHIQRPATIDPYIQPPGSVQQPQGEYLQQTQSPQQQHQHVIPTVDRSVNLSKPALFSNRRYNKDSSSSFVAIHVRGRGGGDGSPSERQVSSMGSPQLSSVSMPPFRPPVQQPPRYFNRHYSSMSPPRPSIQSAIDYSTSVSNYTVNSTTTVVVPIISSSNNTCTTGNTTIIVNDDAVESPSTVLVNHNL